MSAIRVTHLKSLSHLDEILGKSPNKLSVIDFHAVWCGPCKVISPVFDRLSSEYKPEEANFLKCDVDDVKEVAARYKISAMPTFIFLKGNQKVDQIRGADKAGLEATVKKHAGASTPAAFSGKGNVLGTASSSSNPTSRPNNGPGLVDGVTNAFNGLDPQLKVFLALIGAYVVFWWVS